MTRFPQDGGRKFQVFNVNLKSFQHYARKRIQHELEERIDDYGIAPTVAKLRDTFIVCVFVRNVSLVLKGTQNLCLRAKSKKCIPSFSI